MSGNPNRKGFVRVPRSAFGHPDLPLSDLTILAWMATHKPGWIYVQVDAAFALGIDLKTLKAALARLRSRGFLLDETVKEAGRNKGTRVLAVRWPEPKPEKRTVVNEPQPKKRTSENWADKKESTSRKAPHPDLIDMPDTLEVRRQFRAISGGKP